MLLGGDGGRSGVPRHIHQLANALHDRAEIIIASDTDAGGYGFADKNGYTHLEIPGLATSFQPARIRAAAGRLDKAVQTVQPDILWAHARLTLPLARMVTRKRPGLRLSCTYHGIPFGPGHRRAAATFFRRLERHFLAITPRHDLIFLTEEDHAAFPPQFLARHRCHVVPNCSDLGEFSPKPTTGGPRRLVMTTRDARQKNLAAAAQIFAQLPSDFRLTLAGMNTDGPGLRKRFSRILSDQAMDRVDFLGPVSDVRPLLAQADGYLMTSRYEGLSIGMLEAFEYGLPIFSTPVGGTILLSRHHPEMHMINAQFPGKAAAQISRVTKRFRAHRAALGASIHTNWQERFSPPVWRTAIHDLFDKICRDPD
jgi:glycosyltransferase involved in cell wall biosynthesis